MARDNNGAKVIGETSYGKGSVQELVGFGPNETSGTLKVTIAKWFTPSGLSINENGIKPDIEVKITEEDLENKRDPQLEKAKEIVKGL
ncbi:MAG: Carboxyl-terminal protease [Parcubacteria group bacterium GW2011_GWB1_48_6]|nr:MAG: Carboxyl-terminal protease [Parcubacteria group bacterium GW2011_GWB1_48_6]